MRTIFLSLFIMTTFFSYSQTPCVTGMAGIYPCNDFDLMSNFNKNTLSTRDGSDIWGWTDPLDNKEYALMTFEDKMGKVKMLLDILIAKNLCYEIKELNNV